MVKAMGCVSEQTPKKPQPLKDYERESRESLSSKESINNRKLKQ